MKEFDTKMQKLIGDEKSWIDLCLKCPKTLDIARHTASFMVHYEVVTIAVVVNICTLNVRLPPGMKMYNSILLLLNRGTGKSTILSLLAESNKWIRQLPPKIFESQLVEEPSENFHRICQFHGDLVTALHGVSVKQREQLLSFWTELLSDGRYARARHEVVAQTNVVFALALENYREHRTRMFFSTFHDRVPAILLEFTEGQIRDIMRTKRAAEKKPFPKIKLPRPKSPKVIALKLTPEEEEVIEEDALTLARRGVMSPVRAQQYIQLFLMSNAALNNRRATCSADLLVWRLVFPLYYAAGGKLSDEERYRNLVREHPGASTEELVALAPWGRSKFFDVKRRVEGGRKYE